METSTTEDGEWNPDIYLNEDLLAFFQLQSSPTESSTSTISPLPQSPIEFLDHNFLTSASSSSSSLIFSSDTSLTSLLPVTQLPIKYNSMNNNNNNNITNQSFLEEEEEENLLSSSSKNIALGISKINLNQEYFQQYHENDNQIENVLNLNLNNNKNDSIRYQFTKEISDMKEVADEEILDDVDDILVKITRGDNSAGEISNNNTSTQSTRVELKEGCFVIPSVFQRPPSRENHNNRQIEERNIVTHQRDSRQYRTFLPPVDSRFSNAQRDCRSKDSLCFSCDHWINQAIIDDNFTPWWQHTQVCHKYPEIIRKYQNEGLEIPQMLTVPVQIRHDSQSTQNNINSFGSSSSPASVSSLIAGRAMKSLPSVKRVPTQQVQNHSTSSNFIDSNLRPFPSVFLPGPIISEFPRRKITRTNAKDLSDGGPAKKSRKVNKKNNEPTVWTLNSIRTAV